MDYDKLTTLLATSATIKLLRAKNAPLILSFLHREFKASNRLVIANYELVNKLADYLEALNYLEADDLYENVLQRAKQYIDDWCNEENRYLRKYPDETGESVHELTSDTEKAFQWIDALNKRDFIGTESRFRDIFAKLRELIEQSSADPEKRIGVLEKKKKEIEDQIREIKSSGKVDSYSNTQIKERFFEINKLGRTLISDFKEVEENFKEITRNIYEKQARQDMNKGAILGYTLDATDELRESDQGKSFQAFWLFLMADNKQDELNGLIDNVCKILEERRIAMPDPFLRRIKIYLHAAGQKVVTSNHRLTEKLSRILAEKYQQERKKTLELIGDIRRLALQRIENPPQEEPFIEIEGAPAIKMVMDRPLGERPQLASFAEQPHEMGAQKLSSADLEKLFNQFAIDRETLLQNIESLLSHHSQVTLDEIIRRYPLTKGLAELITYVAIASSSPHHVINDNTHQQIEWVENEVRKVIRLPQVIYGK
jgi:hypothetical protein